MEQKMEQGIVPSEKQMERFRTLTQIPGLSAHEMRVREYMKKELSRHSAELVFDNLGSVFAVKKSKKPNAPRLMMSGHMDEVGFIVKQITPKGLIKFFPIGRTWEHVIMAQRVTVYSSLTGQGFPGAVASIPPHLLPEDSAKRLLAIEQMLIDIGAQSREDVLAAGIRPGDMIIVDGAFVPLFGGRKLLAKAWDNRFGCALALDVLEEVANEDLGVDLYIGATVQEESGLRFESSAANDNMGDPEELGQQGKGVLLRYIDRTAITHRGLFMYATGLAEKKNIPFQYFMALGGTDSGEIHTARSGCPSITLGVPSRYIHTNSSIMDYRDYAAAKEFSLAFLRSMNREVFERDIMSYSR
ncbi:MAG: peptidase M28 [Spirochaetae bacterium HGW-Spirochaetae-9]|nr:MAG: peptidase M28 [Spirochaetae bacterium HGW-Spirochaetae-9]